MEKRDVLYTVGGNVNWCNHNGEQYGSFSKDLKIELLCVCVVQVFSTQCVQLFATPWTIPARILCPWNSPGKNTGVGSHSFLQGIFPTLGSNLGLPHFRQIPYHLSHQGSPYKLLYDPAIPLLGICLKRTKTIWRDTCTPMFIKIHPVFLLLGF